MTVVVGYVPTDTGFLAVTEAERQAAWRGTDLVIVNVVGTEGYATPTAADERDLDALTRNLTSRGTDFAIRHIESDVDDASDQILKVAAETNAELIVVGLQRRSAVAKALLGSNAQRILLGAACPVLSVRAPA